jgi:hypothetical protein
LRIDEAGHDIVNACNTGMIPRMNGGARIPSWSTFPVVHWDRLPTAILFSAILRTGLSSIEVSASREVIAFVG